MNTDWIATLPVPLLEITLNAVGIYIALIVLTRAVGLRSFSKMSGFDFAITVAVGSVVAATVSAESPPLAQGAFALAVLFFLQWLVAWARRRSDTISALVDNEPLLIMMDGQILPENLTLARMTRGDLIAKLREANVLDLKQVRAVVMETTGDVSVLHGDADGVPLSPDLLEGVRAGERPDAMPQR